jgi:phosphoglycolate phosphatase-like HAD superfamily hydrolase
LAALDLDGTLADTGPLVAEIATWALEGLGRVVPGDIGPPLRAMLAKASGLSESSPEIGRARERFVQAYDLRAGESPPYEGVHALLAQLAALGIDAAIATNKRKAPARLIADAHGWSALLPAGVFGLEDFEVLEPGAGKAAALRAMARERSGGPMALCMAGDAESDYDAAAQAGYGIFFAALWAGAPARERLLDLAARAPLSGPRIVLAENPQDISRYWVRMLALARR